MLDAVRLWTPFHIATSRRRLLVLKLDHLGDFIIAVPAMRALRDHFPGDEITLVCGSWNKSLAESTGLFDTIVGYDFFPPNGSQRIGVTQPHSEFLTGTRGEYDIAVDLRVDGDTRFLLSHVNAKVRCGIGAEYEFPYLDIALPKPSRGRLLDAAKAQHAFSAGDFISNVLVSHPLHWETDFSRTDCCVIFGPYATLPIGAYQATFHFGASGLGLASSLCRIELDVANRTLPIATLRLGRRHLRTGSAILTFTNPDEHGAIEFRVSTHGRPAAGAFRFFGVTVESASSDLDIRSRQWSRLLHRGECVSLLVSLLAERTRPSGTRRTLTKRRTADDVLCEEVRAIVETPGAIFIAPISRSPIKDWPLPNYAALIRLILNQNNRVVLLGTDD
ncbi:MAG TPA: hypothetical protein VN823_09655, partial [Stellaceae bacterium]|nr:hypothetical protein [Stellaceae bacterium]